MAHRKTRCIYDKELTYQNLYTAWKTVSRTCKNQQGVFDYSMFAQAKLSNLLKCLQKRKYWPGRFRCFMVFEPKPRLVMSQSVEDKIVNHFIVQNYLIPLLEGDLIDTNVATRKKKGSSYAMKMIRRYISQMMEERPGANIYALKVDVSKYFYTIDHEILFKKLKKKIKDKDVIEILRRIIDETDKPYINQAIDWFNTHYHTNISHYEHGKGLSIGAMTSQFLAIFFLSDLDHFIKETLRCKWYIRYMDDFVILGYDKAELSRIKATIGAELENLELKVNPKSSIYNCSSRAGMPFLGYRYFIKHGGLRICPLARTMRRIRHHLESLIGTNPEKYPLSYAAYQGYLHPLGMGVVRQKFQLLKKG